MLELSTFTKAYVVMREHWPKPLRKNSGVLPLKSIVNVNSLSVIAKSNKSVQRNVTIFKEACSIGNAQELLLGTGLVSHGMLKAEEYEKILSSIKHPGFINLTHLR